jgi:ferredoxin
MNDRAACCAVIHFTGRRRIICDENLESIPTGAQSRLGPSRIIRLPLKNQGYLASPPGSHTGYRGERDQAGSPHSAGKAPRRIGRRAGFGLESWRVYSPMGIRVEWIWSGGVGRAAERRMSGGRIQKTAREAGAVGARADERMDEIIRRRKSCARHDLSLWMREGKMFKPGLQSGSPARVKPQKTIAVNYDLCHSCGACIAVCPADALFLNDTRLEVNDACTGCERCAKICPMHALSSVEGNTP